MTFNAMRGWLLALSWLALPATATPLQAASPQAPSRTHAQNYKDMVLATCIAQAYRNDTGAAIDAGSSASALRDWTSFDLEESPDAVQALVDNYLARDYANPLVEAETRGVRFDLLKCLDLYHSTALEELVKRLVVLPTHISTQRASNRADKPAALNNDQFRICFVWTNMGPDLVEIVDYH